MSLTGELRYEPVTRRVRASLHGAPVLDTTDAALVWEPRRIVPMYAVPPEDLAATLVPRPRRRGARPAPPGARPRPLRVAPRPGQSYDLVVGDRTVAAAGFAPDDPDLGGRVVLEWAPFDWIEEALPVVGHPHDPFKRIDLLPSERHVVVRLDGVVLADTRRAVALYETLLPARWYVPHDDVVTDLFVGSTTTSTCAYKGHAAYVSLGPDAVPGSAPRVTTSAGPTRTRCTRWRPSRACSASGPSAPTSSSTARPCPARSPVVVAARPGAGLSRPSAERAREVERCGGHGIRVDQVVQVQRAVEHRRGPAEPPRERGLLGVGARRARGRPAGGPASPPGRRAGSGSRPAASAARRHGSRRAPPRRGPPSRCRRRATSGSTAGSSPSSSAIPARCSSRPPGPGSRRRAQAAARRRRGRRACHRRRPRRSGRRCCGRRRGRRRAPPSRPPGTRPRRASGPAGAAGTAATATPHPRRPRASTSGA